MQARGPLMIEHRLIERLIAVFRRRLSTERSQAAVDPRFIDASVDFLRYYADRIHHGKEEDIYFAALERKELSPGERKIMEGLVVDHVLGRNLVKALEAENGRVRSGDESASKDVRILLGKLADLYPGHIEKEDQVFFPAAQRCFSKREEEDLLARLGELDRRILHEKYGTVIRKLEESGLGAGAP